MVNSEVLDASRVVAVGSDVIVVVVAVVAAAVVIVVVSQEPVYVTLPNTRLIPPAPQADVRRLCIVSRMNGLSSSQNKTHDKRVVISVEK